MRRTSFEAMNCSVAQTLEVIGEWWTMLIVRDCFLGITRFDDFSGRLGIARNILADRLAHLVEHGVLTRVAYQDRPVRYNYRLTEKGRDLWLVLGAMRQWGDRWAAPDGPPVVIEHQACGHPATVNPTCSQCGATLDARSLRVRPGPGAERRPAPELSSAASGGGTGSLGKKGT
jgi:DNA-binding HxlR family transcriptional regulator